MKPGFGFMIRGQEVDSMRIVIGSDHAGFEMKKTVVRRLLKVGELEVTDVGSYNTDPVDYPDYAEAVGLAIQEGRAERGIIICGSGVGASVAANKLPGVRAGLCHDTYSARQGVEHDDMNVLALGARVIGPELARELVIAFVRATFSGGERHRRRLAKIQALEARWRQG
jgi:RpiB/LacA/LacB family sugar-phosphate isomerase